MLRPLAQGIGPLILLQQSEMLSNFSAENKYLVPVPVLPPVFRSSSSLSPISLSFLCTHQKNTIYTHILAFVVVFQCHGYQGSENPRHTECSHQAQHKSGSCNRNRLHSFRKLQSESQDHSASCNKQLSGHLCSNHHPTQRYVQG